MSCSWSVLDLYPTGGGGGGGGVTYMHQTCLCHLGIAAVIMWTKLNKADCQIEIWMKILVDWEFIRVWLSWQKYFWIPKLNGINYDEQSSASGHGLRLRPLSHRGWRHSHRSHCDPMTRTGCRIFVNNLGLIDKQKGRALNCQIVPSRQNRRNYLDWGKLRHASKRPWDLGMSSIHSWTERSGLILKDGNRSIAHTHLVHLDWSMVSNPCAFGITKRWM